MKKLVIMLALFSLSACAIKRYPQAPSVTAQDAASMDCSALDQEITKTRGMQHDIKQTGEFDGRTVAGFILDFGIGNGLAKSTATNKANARLNQLTALKAVKCQKPAA